MSCHVASVACFLVIRWRGGQGRNQGEKDGLGTYWNFCSSLPFLAELLFYFVVLDGCYVILGIRERHRGRERDPSCQCEGTWAWKEQNLRAQGSGTTQLWVAPSYILPSMHAYLCFITPSPSHLFFLGSARLREGGLRSTRPGVG